MFFRTISSHLTARIESKSRNTIIVEGARQVGKTTIITESLRTYPQAVQINLETDLVIRKAIDGTVSFKDFAALLSARTNLVDAPGAILFIDEAQESEQLGHYVRSFKEEWKHLKVILTGSSMTRLFRKNQRIPVGRYDSLLITPLCFYEFLRARKKDFLADLIDKFANSLDASELTPTVHQLFLEELDRYLAIGGLPEVIASYNEGSSWQSTRANILLSQEEDFIRKSGISEKDLFTKGLRGVANHLGYSSKYTHISENSYQSKKIISVLKAWKLVSEVEQKGISSTSQFFPKRYIYDIGIAQDLRDLPFPKISLVSSLETPLRTSLGGLLENLLLLQFQSSPEITAISSWKNSSDQNKEVDFVLRAEKIIPIECKASLKNSLRQYYGLREYCKLANVTLGILASLAPYNTYAQDKKTLVSLPIYLCNTRVIQRLAEEFS